MKRLLVIAGFLVALPLALSGLVQFLTRKRQAYGSEDSDTFDLVVNFGGRELKSSASEFAGGSILCAFGGLELDLRDATLDPVGAYLEVDCWFGGVDITVPHGWRVLVNPRIVMGGVDNEAAAHNSGLPEDAPTLEIDARVVMGGISVNQK